LGLIGCGYLGFNYLREKNRKYYNVGNPKEPTIVELLLWNLKRKPETWNWINSEYKKPVENSKNGIVLTFINHSTVLIQINGINILTDPIYRENVYPFYRRAKRHRNPAIKLEDLPKIDLILVSHSHSDHFDIDAINYLIDKFNSTVIIPSGNCFHLKNKSCKELGWWQSINFGSNFEIVAVPAQHNSFNHYFDINDSLWAGYIIKYNNKIIYFAGDTGFSNLFQQIKEKFGNIDIAMLPIAPSEPELTRVYHLNPYDAMKAHNILKPEVSFAIHFGIFPQGNDMQFQAESEFDYLIHQNQITNFITPDFSVNYKYDL